MLGNIIIGLNATSNAFIFSLYARESYYYDLKM